MLAARGLLLRSRHCVEVPHTEVRLLVGRKEKMWTRISSGRLEISVISSGKLEISVISDSVNSPMID